MVQLRNRKEDGLQTTLSQDTTAKEHSSEEHSYSWLVDYLERLEGKEAYREFQERHYDTPEYYALVASLSA